MNPIDELTYRMIDLYRGDAARIQHFLKVHSLARLIGRMSDLDSDTLFVLEAAALVHDIGIHEAERKYGSCDGPLQEKEGPPIARGLLDEIGFPKEVTERVCYLVAHHHTYTGIDGSDYQILVEADFLVNLFEGHESRESILTAYRRIFRTDAGKKLCRLMFGLEEE